MRPQLARLRFLSRKVALKVLPKQFSSDPERLARFKREARAAGWLNHVNIVAAFDIGEDLGNHFIVMEYCEGETLDARLEREKRLPEKAVAEIAIQVAQGLHYAHGHGIIHRDIKPGNIFLTRDGVAKVLDLGLSKDVAQGAQSFETLSGVVLGTPHYISPEQARGAKDVDNRSDIYSLGATMYHLVTGQTPFHASDAAAVILMHMAKQLPDPRDIRPEISEGMVHVITKAMAKEPEDRYATMAEMAEDLEQVRDGQMPASPALDPAHSSVARRRVPSPPRSREPREESAPSSGLEAPPSHQQGRAPHTRQREPERPPVRSPREARAEAPGRLRSRALMYVGGAAVAGILVVVLVLSTQTGSPGPDETSLRDPAEKKRAAQEERLKAEAARIEEERRKLEAEKRKLEDERRKAEAERKPVEAARLAPEAEGKKPGPATPRPEAAPLPAQPTAEAEIQQTKGVPGVTVGLTEDGAAKALLEDFRFVRLNVTVCDEHHSPVRDSAVRLYSKDWPLVYPHGEAFSQTAADGTCAFRVPRGAWTVVAGGGAGYNNPGSGVGLFIVKDLSLEKDASIVLEPAADKPSTLVFFDRSGRRGELDGILAAPSSLVPNCLMPSIGNARQGACRIAVNVSEPISLFLVSKPAPGREGYYIILNRQQASANIECRAATLNLKAVHFDGRDARDRPGLIEWILCFPSLDLGRPAGNVSFRASGKVDAYTNIDFFTYFFWLYFGDPQDWRYHFLWQGVDLKDSPSVALVAGGPLTVNLRILSPTPMNLTQFLLDPVDAHGNHLYWYFSTQSPLKIPIEVRETDQGPVLWSTVFDRFQNPAVQTDRFLPLSSVFSIDWDLGPYGGRQTLRGKLDDPAYRYQTETVTTDHFTIHAPAGMPKKVAALGGRLEAVYGVYADWIGRSPPVTQARNFYIQPGGLSYGAHGQELFQHGFLGWHPSNPHPSGWPFYCLHFIALRMKSEHFTVEGRPIGPSGEKAEAFADLLTSLAFDRLHGQQYGQFSRRANADWFFDSLSEYPNDVARKPRNIRFLIETYLPKRIDPTVTREFFGKWAQAWTILKAKGYNEDEACAALYSVLAGRNLWPLFALCGPNSTETRVAEAMGLLPGDWRLPTNALPVHATQGTPAAQPGTDPWPIHDGKEPIADYAKRVGLPATETLALGGGVKMEFVLVPAGRFDMGEKGIAEPVHRVRISKPFYMAKYETTVAQFRAFANATKYRTEAETTGVGAILRDGAWQGVPGTNWRMPRFPQEDNYPACVMTWNDAQEFCKWAARMTGRGVCLPTDAQWEYACRAGTTTPYNTGDKESDLEEAGWFNKNSGMHNNAVGRKKANAWGLYDMHGNVLEWVQDYFSDKYYAESPLVDPKGPATGSIRVLRGGCWYDGPALCSSGLHGRFDPTHRFVTIGFRVALDVPTTAPGP